MGFLVFTKNANMDFGFDFTRAVYACVWVSVFCFVLQICTGMMRIIRIHISFASTSPTPSRPYPSICLNISKLVRIAHKLLFRNDSAVVAVAATNSADRAIRSTSDTYEIQTYIHSFIHPSTHRQLRQIYTAGMKASQSANQPMGKNEYVPKIIINLIIIKCISRL